MSFFEALIIYLSAGAPFGVLVFFSQRTSTRTAVGYSILATAAWPIVAARRLARSLSRREDRKRTSSDASPIEVLEDLAHEVPSETLELFEIAGHPNPWLATNCYSRSRKKVILSHIDRLDETSNATSKEVRIPHPPEYSRPAAAAVRP
ncbi:MAG TPA: hypothetical protein PLK77_09810 [Pyrinomonadaceae bacterium]|nr:hypothetical protein [Pyrinomonadaceae bacterium]